MTAGQGAGEIAGHGPNADRDRFVPVGINPAVPSPARMYDYYLGGRFL